MGYHNSYKDCQKDSDAMSSAPKEDNGMMTHLGMNWMSSPYSPALEPYEQIEPLG